MVSADRQLIMETNRSLRNIKTELENLLEKGVIDESIFDTISATLPEESPLSGPLRTAGNGAAAASSARATPANNGPTSTPPTQAMQGLGISSRSNAPPSYEDTPPPGPPPRAAAAAQKPVIANARALYRYVGADARDVALEKDDKIAVHEYMNNDWWMGRNLRTGQEGIFPRNYVFVEQESKAPMPVQQPQYGYPAQQGPPAHQNPYNANVPPMAVADGGQGHQAQQGGEGGGKGAEMGKKFGKKLGNAAIFGAGATIGSNIVNSIF
jgi:hypothetical protein